MFTVDGVQWQFPCDIDRVSEMQASDISGMLLNKNYFNDVIGTFLSYTITIVVPIGYESDYARLYNILTQPVDGHVFVLPYNSATVTVTGRVASISDVYKRLPNGTAHWRGIKFTVVSNSPQKTHSLGQVIQRGMAVLPDINGAQTGAVYQYNGTDWVAPMDADEKAY